MKLSAAVTSAAIQPEPASRTFVVAAGSMGYTSIGTDRDVQYFAMGCKAFPSLRALTLSER